MVRQPNADPTTGSSSRVRALRSTVFAVSRRKGQQQQALVLGQQDHVAKRGRRQQKVGKWDDNARQSGEHGELGILF